MPDAAANGPVGRVADGAAADVAATSAAGVPADGLAAVPVGGLVQATLLHPRFRGVERALLADEIVGQPEGGIVVAAQVVEAGLELDAAVLITEAAPWTALVLRAGRCNRAGRIDGAELWWLPPADPAPYRTEDIEAAVAGLGDLEGRASTTEQLRELPVPVAQRDTPVLTRADLTALFDTTAEVDIGPYVLDGGELDVQLAWAEWEPSADSGEGPPPGAWAPPLEWRCPVPPSVLGELLAAGVPAWRIDHGLGRWTQLPSAEQAGPGDVLIVAAADGGYTPEAGFDPASRIPVPGCPQLRAEVAVADTEPRAWMSLDQHSEDTRRQAAELLALLRPAFADGTARTAVAAAYLHDAGKAHHIWQDALCTLAADDDRVRIEAGRPWAKSGTSGRLLFAGDVSFRHELASLLILDGPLRGLLAGTADPDLARYLVLAHHGKLRVRVHDPAAEPAAEPTAENGAGTNPVIAADAGDTTGPTDPVIPADAGDAADRTTPSSPRTPVIPPTRQTPLTPLTPWTPAMPSALGALGSCLVSWPGRRPPFPRCSASPLPG